jgi:polyferredoxin
VFIVDYYLLRRRHWDVSDDAPDRWLMLLPWLIGFLSYQVVNPGSVGWWSRWWLARRADLFTPPTWLGATITSFLVAAALTLVVGRLTRRD